MDPLFQIINEAFGQLSGMLTRQLSRADNFTGNSREDITFASPGSGVATVTFKYTMATAPKHVNVSRLVRKDGAAITAAWSSTWTLLENSQIELTFQGLPASTSYSCNAIYE